MTTKKGKIVKFLCIGYSVTQRFGYIEAVNSLAQANPADFYLCRSGWGGHRIDTVAYMIDIILDKLPCDAVIFELFTSGLRSYGLERIFSYLKEILVATACRDLPVYFLNLYDREIDYNNDFLTKEIDSFSTKFNIPLLDLGTFIHSMSSNEIDGLLIDTVHPSEKGDILYGSMLYEFLQKNPPINNYGTYYAQKQRYFQAISIQQFLGYTQFSTNEKHGFAINFIDLHEGKILKIKLDRKLFIEAIMMCYGPNTGYIRLSSSRGEERNILAYDSFSYYERTGVFDAEGLSGRTFEISQISGTPNLALRKGTPDIGPRVGKIAYIFTRRSTKTTSLIVLRQLCVRVLKRLIRALGIIYLYINGSSSDSTPLAKSESRHRG